MAATQKRDTAEQDLKHEHMDLMQLVSFHVGGEEFGLDILRVQEIIRIQQLTRVPNSPDFVDGVINLWEIIPSVALRKRLDWKNIRMTSRLESSLWRWRAPFLDLLSIPFLRYCASRQAPSNHRRDLDTLSANTCLASGNSTTGY